MEGSRREVRSRSRRTRNRDPYVIVYSCQRLIMNSSHVLLYFVLDLLHLLNKRLSVVRGILTTK